MADDETPGRSGDAPTTGPPEPARGPRSLVDRGYAAWVAVGLVMLVALALIVIVGNDGDDTSGGGTAAATAQAKAGSNDNSNKSDNADDTETTKPDDCADFSLDANLLGVPRVASEPGVHVWHDLDGFHLKRVSGDGAPAEVSGTVTPTGPGLDLRAPDAPAAQATDGTISFQLSGDTDELLFKAPCNTSKVTFDLKSAGAPLTVGVVTVGQGEEPPSVPFTLERGGS